MATRLSKALLCALLLSSAAHAQLYTRFGPANGILKGSTLTPQTSSAAWADVQALLTGTCDASHVVSGAGTCITPAAGTITGITWTVPTGLSISGSPCTSGACSFTLSTALSGIVKGTGTGFGVAAASDVTGLFTGTCNSTTFLEGDGVCATPSNQTITLSGDATGSGTTAIPVTLANSGVTAGSYTAANITVDAKGRVTAASNGAAGATIIAATDGINSTTRTNTTTYSCDTYLTLTGLATNHWYAINGFLTFTGGASTAGGYAFYVGGTAGGGTFRGAVYEGSTNASSANAAPTVNGNGINNALVMTSFPGTGPTNYAWFHGLYQTGSTGTQSLCVEWTQGSANANTSTLEQSWITATLVQ